MRTRPALLAAVVAVLTALPGVALATTGDGGVTVSGTVFLDLDGDGTRGADEPGRANVGVTLRTSATILDAVVTDADGNWTFGNVMPGTYGLLVEAPIDHRITGGTLAGLDATSGEAEIEIGGAAVDAGTVGLGSPVSSGADVAATVVVTDDASDGTAVWRVTAHNIGPADADGPVDLRVTLGAGHEVASAEGDGWDCEVSAAIALCETPDGLPAGTSLPPVTVTTTAIGDVGAALTVAGTVRLDGVFDAAPLNDEDTATTTVGAEQAAVDLDGDGEGDLTDAGAAPTGMLVAALLALVLGATAVRTTSRPDAPER